MHISFCKKKIILHFVAVVVHNNLSRQIDEKSYTFFFRIGPGTYDFKMNLKGSGIGKSPPPRGIQMFKGYKNVALTRFDIVMYPV